MLPDLWEMFVGQQVGATALGAWVLEVKPVKAAMASTTTRKPIQPIKSHIQQKNKSLTNLFNGQMPAVPGILLLGETVLAVGDSILIFELIDVPCVVRELTSLYRELSLLSSSVIRFVPSSSYADP